MRRTSIIVKWTLCVSVFAMGSLSLGQVLLDQTFPAGDRTGLWLSHPNSATMADGSLAYAQSGGSQKMWTYFRGEDNPISLNVGDQLITTIHFRPKKALYDSSSKSFRFGLFNDDNAQVLSDINSDSGGTGDPWTNATGYGVNLALSTGATKSAAPSVGKRTGLTTTSLMGSTAAWTMTSGGSKIVNTLDTSYTLSLTLDYVSASQMDVIFSISNAGGVLSTHTYTDTTDIYTSFEHLFFRFSKNTETADMLDFSRLTVEYIPEPATMVLLGLGGLVSLRKRR